MPPKPNYQFEKRQRELEKKKKKAEKANKKALGAEGESLDEGVTDNAGHEVPTESPSQAS